jgi:ABC-type transport system involved in multi-copper enzyme maturation permease subunit
LNNPVLFNEWKMRMRSMRTPWILFFYLVVLGGITLLYIFLQTDGGSYYSPYRTRELFMILSIMQLGMIFFVVPGLTAGVISGERERQTLNILLTTNVSATRLIVGKWLSSLSFMTFLVFSTIPLYAIVFLYGGVSPEQVVKVFGFYVITMFGIGSVGVLLSTLIKRTGIATVLCYGVFFCYTIGTMILGEIVRELIYYYQRANSLQHSPVDWLDIFYSINPLFALLNIFGEGPARYVTRGVASQSWLAQLDPFWLYSACFGLITVICLLLAIYRIQPVRPSLFKGAAGER